MILFLALACTTDKDNTDTAVIDTATEDTAETDTDAEETAAHQAFPDLKDEYDAVMDDAIPAPLAEMDIGNITSVATYFISMAPMIEIQFKAGSVGSENMTCPTVDGTFPEDGLPQEPVTVTGNGCTDEDGKIYDGQFVYTSDGLTYEGYSVTSPSDSEECPDVTTNATYNGGFRMSMMTQEISYLLLSENQGYEDDCVTETATSSYINGSLVIGQNESGAQVFNGSTTMLIEGNGMATWFDILTEDEVMGEICETEPDSGTNTISNGTDTWVYTFDGATDCDEEPTQMLSINGGEAEEVSGASCAAMPWRTGALATLFAFGCSLFRRQD